MKTPKKDFHFQGGMIKDRRIGLGLNQFQLAFKLKIHPQFLCNIERGVSGLPPKHIRKLAGILKMDAHEIASAMACDEQAYLMKFIGRNK